jgi:hypothetical protein
MEWGAESRPQRGDCGCGQRRPGDAEWRGILSRARRGWTEADGLEREKGRMEWAESPYSPNSMHSNLRDKMADAFQLGKVSRWICQMRHSVTLNCKSWITVADGRKPWLIDR